MQVTQDLIQAQAERTEPACSAILTGKFLVTRTSPQQWTVKNGDKLPYVVSLNPHRVILLGMTGPAPVWTSNSKDH